MRRILKSIEGILPIFKKGKGCTLPVLCAFASSRSGSVLVELALVMPVFLSFLFLLIDAASIFLASSQLDSGLESARRMVSTGEINKVAAPLRENMFRAALCQNVLTIVSCNNVKFDIRAFQNFTSVEMAEPVVDNELNTKAFSSNFGGACEIVVIRAYYEMTSISGLLRSDVQTLKPLKSFITASVAFRNEEYASC